MKTEIKRETVERIDGTKADRFSFRQDDYNGELDRRPKAQSSALPHSGHFSASAVSSAVTR